MKNLTLILIMLFTAPLFAANKMTWEAAPEGTIKEVPEVKMVTILDRETGELIQVTMEELIQYSAKWGIICTVTLLFFITIITSHVRKCIGEENPEIKKTFNICSIELVISEFIASTVMFAFIFPNVANMGTITALDHIIIAVTIGIHYALMATIYDTLASQINMKLFGTKGYYHQLLEVTLKKLKPPKPQ